MANKYFFVGNRRFVLEEMLSHGITPHVIAIVKGTHLERDFNNGYFSTTVKPELCHVIESKARLLQLIRATSFDVLVSNGCPHILPIDDLPQAKYVNIHPSPLPDLKGYDPVIGSILHKRDSGATCHIMDNGIDSGDIISQVRIPFTEDLDVTTLYQLSFMAEREAFRNALNNGFKPCQKQGVLADAITYRRSDPDMTITFNEDNNQILQKIKAFNNKSIGCKFFVGGSAYRVFSASIMRNPYLCEKVKTFMEGVVALAYEDTIIFHKDGDVIRFNQVTSLGEGAIKAGDTLFEK